LKLWCGVMLTACWSGAAVAQTTPLRNLEIFVGNILSYDDNVFRTPDGVSRPGTRGRGDWIIEPTVSVTYTRPLARGEISARGVLSYKFYRRADDLNRENIDLGLRGNTDLRLCNVSGNANFRRGQSDLSDFVNGVSLENAETRIRAGVGVLCGDEIGIRPGAEYQFENVTNSSTIREIGDYRRHSFTGRIGYSRPALGYVSIYGRLEEGSYPNRPSIFPNDDKIRTLSGGIAYSREIGTRLSGSVAIGYMKVKERPSNVVGVPGIPGSSGLTYEGELTYRGGDRISGSLSFSRDTQQSNLLGVDYSIQTRFAATVNYAISPVISLQGNATHTRRQFRGTAFINVIDPLNPIVIGSGDRTTEFGASANFQSFRRLNFALSGTHYIRNSPISGLDYTANRISLTTGLKF
jgi:hypothetical protein